ncbi:MAG: gamma-glutamyl-phosphate reductase, partial [Desulfobulbaceae bacterium]|nr:gamma-glutamyl-phosphate reductase [Desulfobulbaceae bacterium]
MSGEDVEKKVRDMARDAKRGARKLAACSTETKNRILHKIGDALLARREYIAGENAKDLAAGREKGLSAAMLDRLELSDKVIESMVTGLREVAALPDPVGEIDDMKRRPSG